MSFAGIDEGVLKDAAEKALRRDRAGAVAVLVESVATFACAGHVLPAAVLARGAELFVDAAVDRATQRLIAADIEHDKEREKVTALASEIRAQLSPLWASSLEELSAQSREQFLQLARFVSRNLASASGQAELAATLNDLVQRLKEMNEPQPAARVDRVSYAARCRERWGRLMLGTSRTLGRGATDAVSLVERFVPPRCSERVRSTKPPTAARLLGGVCHEPRVTHREQPVLERIGQAKRLVILGAAGSGKSTLLRYVLLSVLQDRSKGPDSLSAISGYLPILAELRDYAEASARSGGLLEAIAEAHARQGFASTTASVRGELMSGPTLLLIDGLDEIINTRLRRSLTEEIIGLATQFPLSHVVVTSRVSGFEEAPFRAADFAIVQLLELNDAEVARFAEACSHPDLAQKLRLRPELLALARTPLLLSLVEQLLGEGGASRTRADIYDLLLRRLAFEWDDDRGVTDLVKQAAPPGSLLPDFVPRQHTVPLLTRMARAMDREANRSQEISDEELRRLLAAYCEECDIRGLKAQRTGDELRELLVARTGVLRLSQDGMWHFAHRTVLEYLVARDAARRVVDGESTPQQLVLEYGSRSGRLDDASEVIPFACGVLPSQLAEQVLLALHTPLTNERNGNATTTRATVGPNTVLAWRALAEMPAERLSELRHAPSDLFLALTGALSIAAGTSIDLLVLAVQRLPRGRWLDALGILGLEHPVHPWFESVWRELLAKLDPASSPFGRSVLMRVKTGTWRARERLAGSALAALASRGCAASLDALITLAAHDRHPRVRARAVEALCFASARHESFAAVRRALNEDPDALVQSRACWTLSVGYAGDLRTKALLRECVAREADLVVRSRAAEQLALAYGGDPSVTAFLRERAAVDQPLREVAARAATTSLAPTASRRELSAAFRGAASAAASASLSARSPWWTLACALYDEGEATPQDIHFWELHLRESPAFGRAWAAASRQLGELESMDDTGDMHRRQAGGAVAMAALIAAMARGRDDARPVALRPWLSAELSVLSIQSWARELIDELLRNHRPELERHPLPAAAREVDLALGPERAARFLGALQRRWGVTPAFELACQTMELEAEALAATPSEDCSTSP